MIRWLRCAAQPGADGQQVYRLTPEQVTMLPEDTRCNVGDWASTNLTAHGTQLSSPALAELYQDAGAKRALWQQICENEPDFYPDAR